MSTILRIGPRDHGRELTNEEFLAGEYEEGYKYELIDGSLYVSPQPDYPHDWVEEHVRDLLGAYKLAHPKLVKKVTPKARVFVPRSKSTSPEPDFAVYFDLPKGRKVSWEEISPVIVVEIVSDTDPDKDYVRNVELYQRVPSILEYWLFDKCGDDDGPVLKVYHRTDGKAAWEISDFGPEDVYTTRLLPGFELPVLPTDA